MNSVPKNRSSEIIGQLNDISGRGSYVDETTFEMRRIKREIEQVLAMDASVGWGLLGSYVSLSGDLDEVKRCFSASLRLAQDPTTHSNYHACLGNLGYLNAAHQYFVEHGKPQTGMLSALTRYAERMGSFQAVVAYSKEAEEMNIELQFPPSEQSFKVAAVLQAAGVSDDQVVRHMDAAGMLLRKHKMFFGKDIEINFSDVQGEFVGVTCVLNVNKPPQEVFELNVELAMAEIELGVQKHPAFDVMFLPK
jgi:hypothetical protein